MRDIEQPLNPKVIFEEFLESVAGKQNHGCTELQIQAFLLGVYRTGLPVLWLSSRWSESHKTQEAHEP